MAVEDDLPESLSGLLDLLGNKKLLKEKLDLLQARIEELKALQANYDAYASVDVFKAEADELMAQAKHAKKVADNYAAMSRGKADADAKRNAKKFLETDDALNKRTGDLRVWEDELKIKEAELAKREESVARDLAAVTKAKSDAEKMVAEAKVYNDLRTEYEGKLSKLKELSA